MLPKPVFDSEAEPLATPWGELECDLNPKPGVELFRDFIVHHQGGVPGRIIGTCGGPQSGHASGRAWDWMISALNRDSKARADEVVEWLLANDAEMFRRVGLRYLIWNKRQWSSTRSDWRPYGGFDASGNCPAPPCRNPHTDHVHFSFGKPGADGQTSFFHWLTGGKPVVVDVPVSAPSSGGAGAFLAAFTVAFAGTMYAGSSPRSWLSKKLSSMRNQLTG